MTRHLGNCPARRARITSTETASAKAGTLYHLLVEAKYAKDYWLHLEVPGDATLATLDGFLREIWLECCGHLSQFSRPLPSLPGYSRGRTQEVGMRSKVERVLAGDSKLEYAYDFGSTTHLVIRAVSQREGQPLEPGVVVMARNNPPEITCGACGKPATQVSTEWGGGAWCDDCAEEQCEDYLLPVVNSPRCGVCGYVG